MTTTAFFFAGCLFLLATSFCRMVRTTKDSTVLPIRLVIFVLACACIAAIGAVLVSQHRARWPETGLVWAMCGVQWVTGALWGDGVPIPFRKGVRQ